MPTIIKLVPGLKSDNTVNSQEGSYRITEGGVLQLILKPGNKWEIHEEFSPSAWLSVSGTLWKGNPSTLVGIHGFDGAASGKMLS